jgi:hypothetical protein
VADSDRVCPPDLDFARRIRDDAAASFDVKRRVGKKENALADLCYVTPTFARDINRFALLRKSLALFSPDIPHIAIVHSEDFGVFRERFSADRNLQIIPTSSVLPRKLEAARRSLQSWRGYLTQRVAWRSGLVRPASGWKFQQISKLELITQIPYDVVVFLDSDLTLCGLMNRADYVANGRLRLLETRATSYEDYAFEISRQILIGGDLLMAADAFNYIHQAPRFLTRTAKRLKQRLEGTHRDWHRRFIAEAFPSEYNLLGYCARVLEEYDGYLVETRPPAEWMYDIKVHEDLRERLGLCRQEFGQRRFIRVQSNLSIPETEYLPVVANMIEEFAALEHAGNDRRR